jgi:fumarate hydratase subunit beta
MGKGGMGDIALQSMQEHGAVYLATVGAGASVLARGVTRIVKMVDPRLWLSELEVKEFGPVIVALDAHGHNLFDENWDNARKIAAALSSERT